MIYGKLGPAAVLWDYRTALPVPPERPMPHGAAVPLLAICHLGGLSEAAWEGGLGDSSNAWEWEIYEAFHTLSPSTKNHPDHSWEGLWLNGFQFGFISKAVVSRELTRHMLGNQSDEPCVGPCNDREGDCHQALEVSSARRCSSHGRRSGGTNSTHPKPCTLVF